MPQQSQESAALSLTLEKSRKGPVAFLLMLLFQPSDEYTVPTAEVKEAVQNLVKSPEFKSSVIYLPTVRLTA
jgi:hypothetical protein